MNNLTFDQIKELLAMIFIFVTFALAFVIITLKSFK